jgi:hypothetical protein
MRVEKMKNKLLLCFAISFIAGCATLSVGGKKVYLEKVTKDTMSVETAKKKLESQGCRFVTNIEASIAAGNTDETARLIIGLKNKTAEVGGNAVISSLEANMGMPIFTKGIVYKCEKDLVADGV